MKRRAPLKRSAFKSKAPPTRPAKQVDYSPRPRAPAVAAQPQPAAAPVPKEAPIRDETYRRLVAALPCAHCGVQGFSQAAHGDEGKGLAIKASDDTCYPACGPRPGIPGCHWLIGTSGTLPRDERRRLERHYSAQTRAKLAHHRGTITTGAPPAHIGGNEGTP